MMVVETGIKGKRRTIMLPLTALTLDSCGSLKKNNPRASLFLYFMSHLEAQRQPYMGDMFAANFYLLQMVSTVTASEADIRELSVLAGKKNRSWENAASILEQPNKGDSCNQHWGIEETNGYMSLKSPRVVKYTKRQFAAPNFEGLWPIQVIALIVLQFHSGNL